MALSLKSNSKPAAKKAVVGKSKKKVSGWKKLFLGSTVALLLLAVGFSGYTWWQNKNLKASAYSWQQVSSSGGTVLYMCKATTNSYRVYLQNNANYWASIRTPSSGGQNVGPYSKSFAILNYTSNGWTSGSFTTPYGSTSGSMPMSMLYSWC